MNVSKCFRFISVAIASVLVSAGLVLAASPSYAAGNDEIENQGATVAHGGTLICLGNNSSGQSDIGVCSGTPSQLWHVRQQITLNGLTYNQWENGNSKCLGLAGSTGPQLVIGACSSTSDHTQFWWGPALRSNSEMINGHTGLCAGTKGSGTVGGTLVIEGTCAATPTQEWLTNTGP
jgi:hypothetical protein